MTNHIQNNKISKKNNGFTAINLTVAGIDIGANSIFVCAGKADGSTETREFCTYTNDLRAMVAWLKECENTSVAMESTGVYWIPVYNMLEEAGFEVVLTNAHHVKAVPGRKTDVQDCAWLQKLHSCGLLRGSFRPEGDQLVLRGYTRHRTNLVQAQSTQLQLMHKALTQMNIQLRQVVSDIDGETGMKIMRSIVAGERNPVILAKARDHRCKKSEKEIAQALDGDYREEHIFALQQALQIYDLLSVKIVECDERIRKNIESWENYVVDAPVTKEESVDEGNVESKVNSNKKKAKKSNQETDLEKTLEKKVGVNLTDIPGLNINSVAKLLSEIGIDMSKFPTEKDFSSWLGLCPNNKISGGEVLSRRTKPSANKAAQILRLAALSVARSKTALGAFFRRIQGRIGGPKAITATAHKLAKTVYHMLRNRTNFKDVGQEAFERRHAERALANLKKRAAAMGFELREKEAIA